MRTSSRSQAGSALLMVLWLVAALSAIGLAVASNVRGETERTETNLDDAKSYFAARGAIQRAALHVLWGGYRTEDGRPIYYEQGDPRMDLTFPEAEVRVEIVPEASKLSLNGSRPEDFVRLLMALGASEDRATQITSAIIDWRTPVNAERVSSFDSFYLSRSPSFLPRHSSFQENEELLLVQGMTADLYYGASLGNAHAGLRDCVSVFGSAGAVDINTAQFATLEAVGITPEDAAVIVKERAERPYLDFKELAAMAQAMGPAGSRLRIGGQTIFTLRATARMKTSDGKLSDLRRTVAALVKFNFAGNQANKPVGFEVIRWYDRA